MLRALLAKVKSLLVFTILTASTIGPGTVAMCSKAGADFKTALLWCVLVASVVAFVLQEGAGRLTLVGDIARTASPSDAPPAFVVRGLERRAAERVVQNRRQLIELRLLGGHGRRIAQCAACAAAAGTAEADSHPLTSRLR